MIILASRVVSPSSNPRFPRLLLSYLLAWGSCLGCCSKSQSMNALDEPSKGLKMQGKVVKKASISEDFWSTSTGEMDNSGIQSQRSISSISNLNQNIDHHTDTGTGSSGNPSEFVNHGLLLWNQMRQQWIGDKKPRNRTKTRSWNPTYESLLGTNSPFPHPIPLPEVVDFLVEAWEQEGLYD